MKIPLYAGGGLLLLWLLCALGGNLLTSSANTIQLENILAGPQAGAWLGYDELGRDILPRLLLGARNSLLVVLAVVPASFLIGVLLGTAAAWFGGLTERLVVLLVDVFMAFPGILLAIAFAALLGPGLGNAALALVLTGWTGFARLARAQTLSIRERAHIDAATALGSGHGRIIARHVLPLILAPLLVEASFALSAVVIAEASLSFLGLGVQPPAASWGSMIREGARYMLVAPHLVLAPGMAIFSVVLASNLLGDRLRDHLDKKSRFPAGPGRPATTT